MEWKCGRRTSDYEDMEYGQELRVLLRLRLLTIARNVVSELELAFPRTPLYASTRNKSYLLSLALLLMHLA